MINMATYSNSPLVSYTKLSPNHSGQRTHSIDRITPHCVVGQASVEGLGNVFAPVSRQASCQYGIGADGRVGMYCEEKNRSWCSSSNANDQRAVTIECASDATAPYAFKDVVYNRLIDLCVDICKRNGKNVLIWFGDKNKTLNYEPKSNEMILTVHRWFAAKSCPGDWMYARMGDLAEKVSKRLSGSSDPTPVVPTPPTPVPEGQWYRVRKSWMDAKSQVGAYKKLENAKAEVDKRKGQGYHVFDEKGHAIYPEDTTFKPYKIRVSIKDLYIRTGPGTNYNKRGFIEPNVYTIVEEADGKGATKWGKLKSGVGWISLDYVTKV